MSKSTTAYQRTCYSSSLTVSLSPSFNEFGGHFFASLLEFSKAKVCQFEFTMHSENIVGFQVGMPPVRVNKAMRSVKTVDIFYP
jgi:hypothetical protein